MNTQEKRAWFILAVLAATLAVYLPLAFVTGFHVASLGVTGVFGLAGAAPLIGRREKAAGKPTFDERDSEIEKAATLAGYSIFWLALVLGIMVPFFILGPNAPVTIPMYVFPMLLVFASMIIFGIRALVTVVLYRRGSHA